jgi:hypothetical protein
MSKSEDNTRSTKSMGEKKISALKKKLNDLRDVRIIQKNLVYVIGLSSTLANKEVKKIILLKIFT